MVWAVVVLASPWHKSLDLLTSAAVRSEFIQSETGKLLPALSFERRILTWMDENAVTP